MNKNLHWLVFLVGVMLTGPFVFQRAAAQALHGLSFDGTDDYTATPGFSNSLVGLGSFSMACWVNPANASPSFPNFDGIMGLRNDVNADFYLLHYSSNAFEARFRNSAGTAFTITQGPVQLNTWQHLALVYTGSQLRLFRNGTLLSSVSANGTINDPTVSLEIGRLSYSNTPYYLEGTVDEAAVWGRALSDAEVMCLYKQQLDTASSGLITYYSMDQGQAAGNNVSVPYLEDIRSGYHAYFYGLNLTGPQSNFVNGRQMMGIVRDSICRGGSLNVAGVVFNQGGQYRIRLPRPDQCDSTVLVNLLMDTSDRRLVQNRQQLTAVQTAALSYQWLSGSTNPAPIAGANARTYTATTNGTYRVAIRRIDCIDTSYTAEVRTVNLQDLTIDQESNLQLWPNPGQNQLNVKLSAPLIPQSIQIRNVLGQNMLELSLHSNESLDPHAAIFVDASSWPSGIYTIVTRAHVNGNSEQNQKSMTLNMQARWIKK